jgi:amino acid transporter
MEADPVGFVGDEMQSVTETGLRRSVGVTGLFLYGLGNTIGAGIFVLVGKIAGVAGMQAPLAFLLAALLVAFTAFSYGELASRYPLSAGVALYMYRAFGVPALSVLLGLLIVAMGVISSAGIIRGAVGYLATVVELPDWLVLLVLPLLLGGIAYLGIAASVRVAALLTLLEVLALLLVIWVSREALLSPQVEWSTLMLPSQSTAWAGILLGALLAFYAFIGFEDMVNIAEEVKDPQRTLPLAIVLTLLATLVLYVLVALAAVLNLPSEELAASDAPMALIYHQVTGREPMVISFISLTAVINGALVQMIMASRMLFGLARLGWLWKGLLHLHPQRRTPDLATFLVTLMVLGFALWQPLEVLAKLTSFIVLLVFVLMNLALLRIHRDQAPPPGVKPLPDWLPLTGALVSLGFLAYSLWHFLGLA